MIDFRFWHFEIYDKSHLDERISKKANVRCGAKRYYAASFQQKQNKNSTNKQMKNEPLFFYHGSHNVFSFMKFFAIITLCFFLYSHLILSMIVMYR